MAEVIEWEGAMTRDQYKYVQNVFCNKKSDVNIPDHFYESLETGNSFDPGSVIRDGKNSDRDPELTSPIRGTEKINSSLQSMELSRKKLTKLLLFSKKNQCPKINLIVSSL
jgi:hypothetical protein